MVAACRITATKLRRSLKRGKRNIKIPAGIRSWLVVRNWPVWDALPSFMIWKDMSIHCKFQWKFPIGSMTVGPSLNPQHNGGSFQLRPKCECKASWGFRLGIQFGRWTFWSRCRMWMLSVSGLPVEVVVEPRLFCLVL